jgi:hypothetical protein
MFFVSLILFVLGPLAVLGMRPCLSCRQQGLDGRIGAIEGEIASLAGQVAHDSNEVQTVTAEIRAVGRLSPTVSAEIASPGIWAADMERLQRAGAALEELLAYRRSIDARLAQYRSLMRDRKSELAGLQTAREQNAGFQRLITDNLHIIYIVFLVGAFLTVASSLLWHTMVQRRVDRILQLWST